MKSTVLTYRVDRRQIAYLKFILEGYDGLAVLRTVDARRGLVELLVPPGRERRAEMVLQELANSVMIETVDGRPDNDCMR